MNDKVEIDFHSNKYLILKKYIDALLKLNIIVDNDYLDKLKLYKDPCEDFSNFSIQRLIICDYYNRMVYSSEHGLGRIVVELNGNYKYYDNLVEAILDNYEVEPKFNFEFLHNKQIYPFDSKINFFGADIIIKESNPYLQELNKLAHNIYVWKEGRRSEKIFNDPYFRNKIGNMTIDEFRVQRTKFMAFTLGEIIMSIDEMPVEANERKNLNLQAYRDCLDRLLNRYSKNGKTIFKEITNIDEYKNSIGIYVLCLDNELGYYIGKTKVSIKKRIIQHFKKPNSHFDEVHKYDDVKRIFVLELPVEYIDLVEQDCISYIPNNYLYNVMAGGNSIIVIDSDYYNAKNYGLDEEMLNKIIDDCIIK